MNNIFKVILTCLLSICISHGMFAQNANTNSKLTEKQKERRAQFLKQPRIVKLNTYRVSKNYIGPKYYSAVRYADDMVELSKSQKMDITIDIARACKKMEDSDKEFTQDEMWDAVAVCVEKHLTNDQKKVYINPRN